MDNITIPVNDIIEGEKITTGIIVWNDTVTQALQVIYSQEQILKMLHLAKEHPENGIYFQDRFCQFIILVQLKITSVKPFIDGSIKLLDCHNDLDAALDEYIAYKENKWDENDRNKLMELFQKIEADKTGQKAVMNITLHIPA